MKDWEKKRGEARKAVLVGAVPQAMAAFEAAMAHPAGEARALALASFFVGRGDAAVVAASIYLAGLPFRPAPPNGTAASEALAA